MPRQSTHWRYLALLVLFSKTCHLDVKCWHWDQDAWRETQKKVRSLAGRCTHKKTSAASMRARAQNTNSHKLHMLRSSECRQTCTHLDFSGCCCVSSASVGASVSSPYSTCGAIISRHTYPPLNDFSSSPASHLIKVESLMPFRDPTAFNCIHCHYENEWRQLRTQMFFRVTTESLLMCLVIFTGAAFDWRP